GRRGSRDERNADRDRRVERVGTRTEVLLLPLEALCRVLLVPDATLLERGRAGRFGLLGAPGSVLLAPGRLLLLPGGEAVGVGWRGRRGDRLGDRRRVRGGGRVGSRAGVLVASRARSGAEGGAGRPSGR